MIYVLLFRLIGLINPITTKMKLMLFYIEVMIIKVLTYNNLKMQYNYYQSILAKDQDVMLYFYWDLVLMH